MQVKVFFYSQWPHLCKGLYTAIVAENTPIWTCWSNSPITTVHFQVIPFFTYYFCWLTLVSYSLSLYTSYQHHYSEDEYVSLI